MTYQIYLLHLTNGDVVECLEEYDLPAEKSLVGRIKKSADHEWFTVGDEINGFQYIPKGSILYISTGDVREIYDPMLEIKRRAGARK